MDERHGDTVNIFNAVDTKRKDYQKYLLAAILFLFLLLLMFSLRNAPIFSDEADNLVTGTWLAKGRVLYRDVYEQHPPVMYYLVALFYKFGAHTVPEYRMALYILMAAAWTFMYLRYSRFFGRFFMMCFPVLTIMMMPNIEFVSLVLSERVDGIGLTMLAFECLTFARTRKLTISTCVIVSISVLMAVGTEFPSVYDVLVAAMFVLYLEIRWAVKARQKIGVFCLSFLKRYSVLVGIVALPFAVFIVYFAANGALHQAVAQIYFLNRDVYSKFLPSSFGSNMLSPFLSTLRDYFSSFQGCLNTLLQKCQLLNVIQALLLFSNFVFVIVLFFRGKRSAAVFSALFTLYAGIRGFTFVFHASPFYDLTIIQFSYLVSQLVHRPIAQKMQSTSRRMLAVGVGFSAVILCTPFLSQFSLRLVPRNQIFADQTPDVIVNDVRLLTGPNDPVFFNTLNMYLYLYADRPPATPVLCMVPWYTEWYEDDVVNALETNQPKVIVYDKASKIWDYSVDKFAPNIHVYILNHYTALSRDGAESTVWVRNDYFAQAQKIIKQSHAVSVV